MKRSAAARYARWSAIFALVLAGVTGMVYLERGIVARRERKRAPAAAPQDVERQSSALTFSKVDGIRTIFTVQASKSVDFKGLDASLLEDVRITIFGKMGERHDTLHTQSCQYGKENGSITCSGQVQIELQSAADAERAVAPMMRVETQGVTFERGDGIARTDQLVKFNFPNGSGEASGLEYRSQEGELRLRKDVRMELVQPAASHEKKNAASEGQRVSVTGSSMEFARDTRRMILHGPAKAETSAQMLIAGELSLMLDTGFHAETLVARDGGTSQLPELTSRSGRGGMDLSAKELTLRLAPEGWMKQLEANGAVHGSLQGASENDDLRAENGRVEMWPRVSQPKTLQLSGGVTVQSKAEKTGVRMLRCSAVHIDFGTVKEGQESKPLKAETLGAGSMEWSEAAVPAGGATARSKLQADKLAVDFGAQGRARQLMASGNVQTERSAPGKLVQTATAKSAMATLTPGGGWSQMELQGDVKLSEGARRAQAERAVFERGEQSAVLTGHAMVRDAGSETQAAKITFLQATGEIHAEGDVRSSELSSRSGSAQRAAAPANISADVMQANSKTGRALYTGHAKLWQGDAVMEGEFIELLRDAKVMNAAGNVRAVFPQMVASPASKAPVLWRLSAGKLSYKSHEGQAHLEQNVVVQSADQKIRGAVLELYFTSNGKALASQQIGSQQISRAVMTGGVVVEQGERRGAAERGEYTASDGKFVLSGGTPTLYDAANGTTTGRQLTFFLADDTIIVDSENGSRTLTRHRVEK